MNTRLIAGPILIALSCVLGIAVQHGAFVAQDVALLHAMSVAERGPQWLGDATRFISTFGDVGVRGVGIALVLAALLLRHRWRSGVIYLVTTITSILGHTAAKILWARERPHLVPWLDDPHDMSFPSGHAAGTMVVLLLAALLFDRYRLWSVAILLSLVIGLTRPMLGVHWPSDVIGGWLWGAGFALIGAGVAQSMGLLDTRFQKDVTSAPS